MKISTQTGMERTMIRSFVIDGWVDLLLGIILLEIALMILLSRFVGESILLFLLTSLFFIFIIFVLYNSLFKKAREKKGIVCLKKRTRYSILSAFVLTLLFLIMGIILLLPYSYLPGSLLWIKINLHFAIILNLIIAVLTYKLNQPHLLQYGILILVAFPLGKWFDIISRQKIALPFTIFAIASIMLIQGIYRMQQTSQ